MRARTGPPTSNTYLTKKRSSLSTLCSTCCPSARGTEDFAVLGETHIDAARAKALADAVDACWQAILDRDATGFGASVRASFEAQIAMFPRMVTPSVQELIEQVRDPALGWKLSGAGGGGYLVVVADQPLEETVRPYARRAL